MIAPFRIASPSSTRRAARRYLSSSAPPYPMDPIVRVDARRSVADAIRPHYRSQSPVILEGLESPAMSKWNSIEYLIQRIHPQSTGSVEMGGSYNDPSAERMDIWSQKDDDSSPPANQILYMAQNDLPEELRSDLKLPEFCGDSSFEVGNLGRLYQTMWWIGPRECVSPLHFDPLDNLLLQLVGRKRVILFDADSRVPWHYAGDGGQQRNTSPIDPERDDNANARPLFERAPTAKFGVLEPGDALYVPARWWHHVRSLDMSCSVNMWWR